MCIRDRPKPGGIGRAPHRDQHGFGFDGRFLHLCGRGLLDERLCAEQLGWKVTTTYTVIKRLSERGVIKNENTIVSSLVSKEQIQTAEIEELVEKKFAGSIPAFLTAFTKSQQLTADEIQEMQQMIDRFRKEHPDD